MMTNEQEHRLELAIGQVGRDTGDCKERLARIEEHLESVNGSVHDHGQRLTLAERAIYRIELKTGQSWLKFVAQLVATFAAVVLFLWKLSPAIVNGGQ